MALNAEKLIKVAEMGNNQRLFYDAGTDDLSVVAASGYFDGVAVERHLQTGDIVEVVANAKTDCALYLITNTSGVITVKDFAATAVAGHAALTAAVGHAT